MDKLIKSIPKGHMDIIITKADIQGISSSAYIRGLIRQDVGVTDMIIRDIPYGKAQEIKRQAVAAGLTMDQYVIKRIMREGVLT